MSTSDGGSGASLFFHTCGALLLGDVRVCEQCHAVIADTESIAVAELLLRGEIWLRGFNARFGMSDAFQALVLRAIRENQERRDLAPTIQMLRGMFGRMSDALTQFQSAYAQLEELLQQTPVQEREQSAVPVVPASSPVSAPALRRVVLPGASQRSRAGHPIAR